MDPTEVPKLRVDYCEGIQATITIPASFGFKGTDVNWIEVRDAGNGDNRKLIMRSNLTRTAQSVSFTIPKLSDIIPNVKVNDDLEQLKVICDVYVIARGKDSGKLLLTYKQHRAPLLYLAGTAPGADLKTMTYNVEPGKATVFEVKYVPTYLVHPLYSPDTDGSGDVYWSVRLSLFGSQPVDGLQTFPLALNAAGTQTFSFTVSLRPDGDTYPDYYLQVVTESPPAIPGALGEHMDKTNLVVIKVLPAPKGQGGS